MSKSLRSIVFGVLVVAAQLALPATHAKAGPFLDWLFGRPIYTYPSPTVTNYAPIYGTAPAAVAPPVTAGYAAGYVPPCATGNCAPTVAGYAPATTLPAGSPPVVAGYAPSWPASNAPAVAGYPTTYPATYPATANYPGTAYYPGTMPAPVAAPVAPYSPQNYLFQPYASRYVPNYRTSWYHVPLTYYRPVTAYQGVAAPATPVMQPCNTYAWQAQRVPSLLFRPWLPAAVPYAPVPYAPAVAQPVVAQPMYVQPTVLQPAAGSAPLSAAPAAVPYAAPPATMLSAPCPTSPTYTPPASGPGNPTTVPADQPPTLSPGSYPSDSVPNSAMRSLPSTSAASSNRVAPSSVYQVTPIPVPEIRERRSSDLPTAPPLLNGRERTASAQVISRHPAVTPAVWAAPVAKPVAPPPAAAAPKLWDDSGWSSAKSW